LSEEAITATMPGALTVLAKSDFETPDRFGLTFLEWEPYEVDLITDE